MWTLAQDPIKQRLRQIAAVLRARGLAAGPALLDIVKSDARMADYAIDAAEACAGQKHLDFARVFADRADDTGRRCSIFCAIGANRSAKSFVAGWLCFAKYIRDRARNGDWYWCVGQTFDRSVLGQQRELWEALPRSMFHVDGRRRQAWNEDVGFGTNRRITLRTRDGGRCVVEFRSNDQAPKTFEQAKLNGVWCDEKLDEGIYNRLLYRIIDRRGFILYSDIPEQFWQVHRLKEAVPEAGVHYVTFQMTDNIHNLPPGEMEAAAARSSEDEKRMRILGEHVVMQGLVYGEFIDRLKDAGGHLVNPFRIPAHWPRYRMIDYGGSSPTACLWIAIAENEHTYRYREYYFPGPSVQTHARNILEMSQGEVYRCTYIDPAAYNIAPGNVINIADQYEQAGIPVQPWFRTQEMGEHAMVQRVKYQYENRRAWVFMNLINFRREKRSWKYKCDEEGRPIAADAFENANNHLMDCEKGYTAMNQVYGGGGVEVSDSEPQPEPPRKPPTWRNRNEAAAAQTGTQAQTEPRKG